MQENNNKCRGGLRDNLENKFLEKSINTNDVIMPGTGTSAWMVYIFLEFC